MMFFFSKADVLNLVEHASKSSAHRSAHSLPPQEQKDIQAGLWLVKSKGIHLESSGADTPCPIVYAHGFAPNENMVSGCDFAHFIPLTELHLSSTERNTSEHLSIFYGRDKFSIQWMTPAHLRSCQSVA